MKDRITPYLKDILGTTTKIATWVKAMTFILFVPCVFVTFHYLFLNFPRKVDTDSLSFDYVGMLIGIFGVLITLLVGWQIFSNIKEKERIDRLVAENEELKREVLDYKKSIDPRISKMEECCEKRGHEIINLVNKINESFDRTSALNETYIADLYEDLLLEFHGMSPEFRYLSHRIQAIIYTSNFDDIEGCNIMVHDIIQLIEAIRPITLQRRWRSFLIEDYLTIKHSDKIIDYLSLKKMLEEIVIEEEFEESSTSSPTPSN